MDANGLSRTNFDFLTVTSRTFTDFYGRILNSPWTPHGRSHTFTDNSRFPHGHLTNIHGLLRTNFYILTDTSCIFSDFHGRIFISLPTLHRRSWTFILFFHGHLTDAHGLSRTYFDFPTDTSRTFTDFYGRILNSPWTPQGRLRTFTDVFLIFPRTPHGSSRTITGNF